MKLKSAAGLVWILAFLTGVCLFAFGEPTLAYFLNILAHLVLGAALIVLVAVAWRRAGALILSAAGLAAAMGLVLFAAGGTRNHEWIIRAHAILAFGATLIFGAQQASRRWLVPAMAGLMLLPFARFGQSPAIIVNPASPPESMDMEGGGKTGPFFPSAIETSGGGHVSADFIMESKACAKCHSEIYDEWKASMHHMSSFNNPFYRKSIEYMQPISGIQATKWCAGCHDHAVLLNGMMDRPVSEIADTPEGQSGMGCLSCHAVTKVKSTMGNADIVIDESKWARMFSFLTTVNSKPHRRAFLKTFHTEQPSEFCSACHKVHLDVPVNAYRWVRGFDEYDNWQASGVSGLGARSFYYPQQSQTCVGCHMPLIPSSDPAARNGKIRSHFFPGANTAVPVAIQDPVHLKINESFLKSNKMRVDIFAASPVTSIAGNQPTQPTASTTFASGEESDDKLPRYIGGSEPDPVIAPLNSVEHAFKPGEDVRIDVVVRTLALGHFFPAGTVDAFDTWLELRAMDDAGRVLFWSGRVDNDGPVDPSAHFYRSLQIDGNGNPINKRNAFESRATMYVNLIPPGAADVAHFLLRIPRNASGKIHLTANLNYRKFTSFYSQFVYEGKPAPPNLPVVNIASSTTDIVVGGNGRGPRSPLTANVEAEAGRWNDYGIGLLRQGDLVGALRAFRQVTELHPKYADGWVNVSRVLIEEGETAEARKWLDHALALSPNLGRARFFRGLALKADGDYDGALKEFEAVAQQYPRDRVNLNQAGRIHFLKRDYKAAIEWFTRTVAIDPEDVSAHYNLMLCYRGLNDAGGSAREEKLYLRFKADETAPTRTGDYRRDHPIDNNERQPIHLHEGSR